MMMIECGAAYGDAPQIAVRFMAEGVPVQLVLRLPLLALLFRALGTHVDACRARRRRRRMVASGLHLHRTQVVRRLRERVRSCVGLLGRR